MKAQQLFALLLIAALGLALSACGGSSPSSQPEIPAVESTVSEVESEVESNVEAEVESTDSNNPYGLDYASESWQAMSSDRLSKADLLTAYETIEATAKGTMTYEDVVSLIGVDATEFKFSTVEGRIYSWSTSEDEYTYIRVLFEETDGDWLNSWYSKTNM